MAVTKELDGTNTITGEQLLNTEYNQDFGQPRAYDPGLDVGAAVRAAKEAGLVNLSGVDPSLDAEAARVAQALKDGKIAFVSPMNKRAHILVKGGKLTPCYAQTDEPVVAGVPATNGTEMRRLGDIFLDFEGGITILDPSDPDDQVRILWCEANPSVTRNCMAQEVEQWTAMKEGQLNTAIKEPSLDPGLDVDRVLAGDYSAFGKAGSLASRARAILHG